MSIEPASLRSAARLRLVAVCIALTGAGLAPARAAHRSNALPRAVGGNQIKHYYSDDRALTAVLRDLRGRSADLGPIRKIQYETYDLGGAHGRAVAEALALQARQGAAVQVLLHPGRQRAAVAGSAPSLLRLLERIGVGSGGADPALVQLLERAGATVLPYATGKLNRPLGVAHAKLLVINDEIAWVGGMNFDADPNRDLMSRVKGPAVSRFQRTLHEGWSLAGGTVLPKVGQPRPAGDAFIAVAQSAPHERTTRPLVLRELRQLRRGDELDLWMMDLSDHQLLDAIETAVRQRGVRVRALLDVTNYLGPSGGVTNRDARRHKINVSANGAGWSKDFTVPAGMRFVTCPVYPCTLTLTATGAAVVLRSPNDQVEIEGGKLKLHKPGLLRRLASGVPDLYGIDRLQRMGVPVKGYVTPPGRAQLHAKVIIVRKQRGPRDRRVRAICGSANAISSAYDNNRELAFLLYGGRSCQGIVRAFENDYAGHARDLPLVREARAPTRAKACLLRWLTDGVL